MSIQHNHTVDQVLCTIDFSKFTPYVLQAKIRITERMVDTPLSWKTMVMIGEPGEQSAKVIKKKKIDLVVAASHGISDFKRILIVDWDVHHGNGIQHIFEHDPSVLYLYPFTDAV